jgi:hypothetical protein
MRRYKVIITSDENKTTDEFLNTMKSDPRVVFIYFIYDQSAKVYYMIIEFDYQKSLQSLKNTCKHFFDINTVEFKKFVGSKKETMNAFIECGLNQGEIPWVYYRDESKKKLSYFFQ